MVDGEEGPRAGRRPASLPGQGFHSIHDHQVSTNRGSMAPKNRTKDGPEVVEVRLVGQRRPAHLREPLVVLRVHLLHDRHLERRGGADELQLRHLRVVLQHHCVGWVEGWDAGGWVSGCVRRSVAGVHACTHHTTPALAFNHRQAVRATAPPINSPQPSHGHAPSMVQPALAVSPLLSVWLASFHVSPKAKAKFPSTFCSDVEDALPSPPPPPPQRQLNLACGMVV